MNRQTIRKYLVCLQAAMLLLATACTKDELPGLSGGHGDGMTLSVVTKSMSPETVVTRAAGDSKTEAEREIKELHVFMFGKDGQYLKARQDGGGHIFQGYQVVSNTSTLRIDNEGFADSEQASNAQIYVVANVEAGTFGALTEEGYPENIKDEADFKRFYYRPQNYTSLVQLPESGMPMAGQSKEPVNLTKANGEVVIEMKALMSRIDFTFKLDSDEGETGKLPSLRLTEYEVQNMVTAVPFIEPVKGEDGKEPESNLDMDEDGEPDAFKSEERSIDLTKGVIYNKAGEVTLSFYVFENLRQAAYNEETYQYPAKIDPDAKQCYKPLLAVDENDNQIPATYVVFSGIYTDSDNKSYNATCTVYLGSDPVDDFNLKRNHQYRNNVTVSGITRTNSGSQDGSISGEVTFDARINVEATSPYYVSILRQRNLDAHFNVIPLDVYLFDEENTPTMDIEIENATVNDWLRIEKVSCDVMASGNAGSDVYISHSGQAFAAGTGKRKFFTENLVTETLAKDTSYSDLGDRDRIYIYVDENISTKGRTAELVLTYKENGVKVGEPHVITLEQHGLMKVIVEDGGVPQYTIYAEAYEEYLNYYDPLSEWESEQVYTGLPWGPEDMGDISTGFGFLTRHDAIEGFFNGNKQTIAILIEQNIYDSEYLLFQGDGFPTKPLKQMILDEKPASAAEYCYRKNKTDENGYIYYDNMRWYLPTIRELENTVTTYYATTPELQNSFYWSCNPAQRSYEFGDLTIMEATQYARSTKAYIKEGKIAYIESGVNDYYDEQLGSASEGGKALRTTSLRIRAVYRPADNASIE